MSLTLNSQGSKLGPYLSEKDGPWTLPSARYTSPEFHALEVEKLWSCTWQLVCRDDQLPRVGDYMEYSVGPYTALIVHGEDGTFSAMSNTCLHRGRQLREGTGNAKELRCAYHGWRYNLDGTIKAIFEPLEFDSELIEQCDRLPQYQCDLWNGFIFINFDNQAPPLSEFVAPIQEVLAKYGWDKMATLTHKRTVMDSNWKAAFDGFQDGWHVVNTHPQATLGIEDAYVLSVDVSTSPVGHSWIDMGLLVPGATREGNATSNPTEDVREMLRTLFTEKDAIGDQDFGGPEGIEKLVDLMMESWPAETSREALIPFWAKIYRQQYTGAGVDVSHLQDGDLLETTAISAFPNLWIVSSGSAYTGGVLMTWRPNGNDPETCITDIWTISLVSDETRKELQETGIQVEWYPNFWDYKGWSRVLLQDLGNTKWVQRGYHDPSFPYARLGRLDGMIMHHNRTIDEYLSK